MPESISTSNRRLRSLRALGVALALLPSFARADGANGEKSKAYQPEEDDFSNTPFTEYGEFSEQAGEEADAKFFAHGRFFGASIGMGLQGATGNRGAVYEGGFPLVDLKLHYWFDFNFAFDMNVYFASHFTENPDGSNHVDVNFIHAGLDIKYYFDTKNLSAPISFANPYLMAGFGAYSQIKSSFDENVTEDADTGIGLSFGAGLEFAISPKKAYLELEGRFHMVTLADTFSTEFQQTHGVPDLTGGFFTVTASVLFTW